MMTALYAFSSYILLFFIARFVCLNGLVYCVWGQNRWGDNVDFHAIEGYLEGVTANHSCGQVKRN
jgi:hypothetical protein